MEKNTLPGTRAGDKFLNALAEAYRLQEAIINTSELCIISASPDGLITSFNKAAELLLGYNADEIIGKATFDVFHDPEEIRQRAKIRSEELGVAIKPGFEACIAVAKYKHVADRSEWTYIRKDGSRFPVLLSISALWDEKHNLIGYAGMATDISEQKKIMQRIKESEAHLQSLVSSLDDIVFELDDKGRFCKIWVKSDDSLFLPREKIYGHTLTEIFGEAFAEPFEAGFVHVLKTGENFNREYKSIVGEERWFNARYSLIYENGVPTNRVSLCIQDITARKKVELSLRESEEKFRLLAENIPGVVYLCRNDDTYSMIYLNDKVEKLTGYTAAEFLSGAVNFMQCFHQDDKERIVSHLNEALANKVSFYLEYRFLHKSGEHRWFAETGIGVYDKDTLVMIEGYISDITARKEADEELIRMADENSRVFNSTLNLSALIGFDGYFKKLNPAWKKSLGWPLEELQSKKFTSFVHPDDLEKTVEATSTRGGKDLTTFENRYRCRDGTYRWLYWSTSHDVPRKIIYASVIDITNRKKSEEELLLSKTNLEVAALELQEQNRQLDEFAHIISHNLRSPVGNIKALISFINEDSSLEDYQVIFGKIKKVANNLNETMNELMETLKVKKNTEVERVELRFKDVLDKVVQSLEGELIECGATVTFDFNAAPKIGYSKTYLESIFQNLLSNAIKYRSPERTPQIHISTAVIDNRIALRVKDNGLGIDMQRYGHKLFGLHKTFHENKEARGVGLFLTKTQVEALGGTITAESKVNEGTTFIIHF